LPDPVEALRKVVAHLAPHGIVFVKVPNGNYFLLRHVVEHHLGRWFGADEAFGPSRRVAHYTVETLNKLAQSVGLKRLAGGACRPIESPPWFRWSGLWLEMEPPMLAWWPHRLVRRALHTAGRLEAALFRARNHLSQALFVVAARAE
jgi:hypothetical protein